MAWSKVISNNNNKPLKWWIHKYLCEFGWLIRHKDECKTYYKHLNCCISLGFNLYGDKI